MSQTLDMTVTDAAIKQMVAALESEDDVAAIRVECQRRSRTKFDYQLDLADEEDQREDDHVLDLEGITLWVDAKSAGWLSGVTLDFIDDTLQGSGFKFENPLADAPWDDPVAQRLQELIDSEINPGVASHGGVVELLNYAEGVATIHMGGGCQGCGQAGVTLREGIQTRVKEVVPEVVEIVDGTDHSAGENPYY